MTASATNPARAASAGLLLLSLASSLFAQDTAVAVDLRGGDFRRNDMSGANLAGADVRGANFRDADVTGVCFWRTRIDKADFRGAKGLSRRQLSTAQWAADAPPNLGGELHAFRRLFDQKKLIGVSLSAVNWWAADRRGFHLTGANLSKATLIAADLRGASLRDADLSGACLAGAQLSGADLRGAKGFTAAQLLSARWSADHPPRVDPRLRVVMKNFEKRRLIGANLRAADLWQRDLRGANMTSADLSGAALLGANLRGVIFRDANLTNAFFADADISGADFRGAKFDLRRLFAARWDANRPPVLDMRSQPELQRFIARRMPGSDLSRVNLWGGDLSKGNFTGASFSGAVLIDANLRGAVLRDANLSGVDLTGADLTGADLIGAKSLTVGQLLSARWDAEQPPRMAAENAIFGKLWPAKNIVRRVLPGAVWYGRDLSAARFHGSDLRRARFVAGSLRGADLRETNLGGAVFSGVDISGADLRGARNVTPQMLISARWDPKVPPVLGSGQRAMRLFFKAKRFEFSLGRVNLQVLDPAGTRGPVHGGDDVARFRPSDPPRLGMKRLHELIHARELGRIRLVR